MPTESGARFESDKEAIDRHFPHAILIPHMDLSEFRKEYSAKGMRRKDLDEDPIVQFTHWFQQALDLNLHEPNAMSLATVDEFSRPLLRTVLLKYLTRTASFFSPTMKAARPNT